MKILLYNPCYFRGVGGKLHTNLKYSYRHIYCSPKTQIREMDSFVQLVSRINPNIIALIEVESGSATNKYLNQLEYLKEKTSMLADAENKYTDGHFLKYNRFYVGKSNGFLSTISLKFHKIDMKVGFKSLVYVIDLEAGVKLFIVHLATVSLVTRKKQIQEIRKLVNRYERVIICGDFNIYTGIRELEGLIGDGSYSLVNNLNDFTFPSENPKALYDLFIVSSNLLDRSYAYSLQDFNHSDHLPVLLDIQI